MVFQWCFLITLEQERISWDNDGIELIKYSYFMAVGSIAKLLPTLNHPFSSLKMDYLLGNFWRRIALNQRHHFNNLIVRRNSVAHVIFIYYFFNPYMKILITLFWILDALSPKRVLFYCYFYSLNLQLLCANWTTVISFYFSKVKRRC